MPMTDEQIDRFLRDGAKLAVLSTVDAHGRPRSVPLWYEWRDGCAVMFTGRTSLKWRNLQRTPYASLCVDRREVPYAAVVIAGAIEELPDEAEPLYDFALRLATRYYGPDEARRFAEPYRAGSPTTVRFRLRPQRVASWDYAVAD